MKNTYFKFIDPVRAKEYVTFNNIIAPNINTIGNKNCKTLTSDWCFFTESMNMIITVAI